MGAGTGGRGYRWARVWEYAIRVGVNTGECGYGLAWVRETGPRRALRKRPQGMFSAARHSWGHYLLGGAAATGRHAVLAGDRDVISWAPHLSGALPSRDAASALLE